MDHSSLLYQAKQQQKDSLKQSEHLVSQLGLIVDTVIRHNSKNDANGPSILDKITTIHELDKEIDRQLADFSGHFSDLMALKMKLQRLLSKNYRSLNTERNVIDVFQSRSESIDRELRILENTLGTIRYNK